MKTYIVPHSVYVDGVLIPANTLFATASQPGAQWVEQNTDAPAKAESVKAEAPAKPQGK